MKEQEVQRFAVNLAKKYNESSVDITETAMSWIVLTKSQAFKIKKPLKSRLYDFSDINSRKRFCEAEVELNQKLAPNVYLGVIPIVDTLLPSNGQEYNGIIDYAVLMKRLRIAKQMNRMLDRSEVNKAHILKLVRYIVRFHAQSKVVNQLPITSEFKSRWHTLVNYNFTNGIPEQSDVSSVLKRADTLFKSFIIKDHDYLNDRKEFGKVKELHGNLQCDNVYLYNKPLILDCIEFSDTLRHVDILNEAALLCMDLEAHGEHYLSGYFYKEYKKRMGTVNEECDDYLFVLYKLFHALKKAKENNQKAVDFSNRSNYYSYAHEIEIYGNLINSYVSWLDRAFI